MAKQFKITAISTLVAGMSLLGPVTAFGVEDTNVLPDAASGECYAKVLVPPVYKTESIEAIVSEATEKLQIIPAKYTGSSERIMVKDASSKLEVVDPVYEVVDKRVQISASFKEWVRGSAKGTVAVSEGMLADLAKSGVDIDSVESGVCFYEHHKPAIFKKIEEKILVSEATEALEIEEAKYATSDKQVLIKAASKRLVEVPAVFKTVEDKVLVEPAKSVWKKGTGPIQRIDNTTGEIMCRVDIPAVYENFPKRIVAAPPLTTTVVVPSEFETLKVQKIVTDAKEIRKPIPAKYETIAKRERATESVLSWVKGSRGDVGKFGKATGNVMCHREIPAEFKVVKQRVVKTPGSFKKVEIPAVFKNVKVQKLVTDATVKKSPIAEEKKQFIKRLKVSDARLEWRPVLCETNMGDDTILSIQKALADKGYNPGVIDGVIGRGTMDALARFQKAKDLPQGGITYPTLKELGVKL